MQRFTSKIAIVTGAGCVGEGWGNGRAMAVRLAQEGAKVFAIDRDMASLEETLSRAGDDRASITPYVCDVTDSTSIQAMVQTCVETLGVPDILINNVGGSAAGGPVQLSEQMWDTQIDVNLKSVFLTCKYVLPHMLTQKRGAIINIASTSGIRWTGSAQVAYAASKAGVIHMSRVIAVQYATEGIRVNSVVPGQLHTPMVETRLAKQRTGGDIESLLASRLKRIPVGFMGDGRDTASAALYLASDEARFITGTELIVDGGMTARCD